VIFENLLHYVGNYVGIDTLTALAIMEAQSGLVTRHQATVMGGQFA